MKVIAYEWVPMGIWCAECWNAEYRDKNIDEGEVRPIYDTDPCDLSVDLYCESCDELIVGRGHAIMLPLFENQCFCGNPNCHGDNCYWTEDAWSPTWENPYNAKPRGLG